MDTNETNRKAGQPSAAATGWAALSERVRTELLEDEAAITEARNNSEWERCRRLEGHHDAMLTVKHWLEDVQPNDELSHGGRP